MTKKPSHAKDKVPEKKKSKMGRPKIPLITPDLGDGIADKLPPLPIVLEDVYYWMDIGATEEEIAGSFRVSVKTLRRRLVETTGLTFGQLKEKVCGQSKINLRKNQFKMSENNASMAIWLGKVLLGQKEDNEVRDQLIQSFSQLLKAAQDGKLKSLLEQPEKVD